MRLEGLFAAAAAVTLSTSAWAGCDLRIQPSSENWQISGFDPFDGKEAVGQFDAIFINSGDAPCSGRVQLDLKGQRYGLSAVGGKDQVNYAIIDADSQTDLTPRAGASTRRAGVRSLDVAAGAREFRRFTLLVDPGDLPASGDYSQTAFLSVRSDDGLTMSERPVTLALNVASSAVMGLKGSFTPTSGGGLVQLGELAEGKVSLPLHLYVKSTSGYRVTVASTNLGKLKLGKTDWAVDYDLSLGATPIDLKLGGQVTVSSTKAQNDNYALSVFIHSVKGQRAGAYSDTVTFTVAAL